MTAKLLLIALGVDPARHATVEALQALSECDAVCAPRLAARDFSFLSRFARPGTLRRSGEGRILKELGAGKTVGLALSGGTLALETEALGLIRECVKRKVPWSTTGSVSPTGVAISGAGATLGTQIRGLQTFEAAVLCQGAFRLQPAWALIVHFFEGASRGRLESLARRLAGDYGRDADARLCFSSGKTRALSLRKLSGLAPSVLAGAALYLPPRRKAPSQAG